MVTKFQATPTLRYVVHFLHHTLDIEAVFQIAGLQVHDADRASRRDALASAQFGDPGGSFQVRYVDVGQIGSPVFLGTP